ncbi:MAG: flavodoxin-dependent (E)-4-hydroxy-3-methylbut-2-enyl-diphosphate synthase, partial [Candidatus Omnitrophota bacterium]|nr:flavodoxin-dependent (E)-4-hydroxy-3-methylbut-2-enyl-diphosphate synthase [Candidatus Omnitrophota bacterium]
MTKIIRRKTKTIRIGNILIGGNNPIAIQSMAKIKTTDIENTIRQIKELESVGCEIVRLAVKDIQDAKALRIIKQKVNIPIVSDIHFDWRLAIEAIDSGTDKIRLNPGNIYKKEQIREIARAAKLNRIPIRVGVNSGSLKIGDRCKVLGVKKNLKPNTSDFMVQSALNYIKILEGFGFYDIVVSLKGSDIFDTIEAYRKMAKVCDYPFHLGVTAAGSSYSGTIKSTIAFGILLSGGIGD